MLLVPPITPDAGAVGGDWPPVEMKSTYTIVGPTGEIEATVPNVNVYPSTSYTGTVNAIFLLSNWNAITSIEDIRVDGVTITDTAYAFAGDAHMAVYIASIAAGTSSVTVSVKAQASGNARVITLQSYVINGPTYEVKGIYTSTKENSGTTHIVNVSTNIPASCAAVAGYDMSRTVSLTNKIRVGPTDLEKSGAPRARSFGFVSASGTDRTGAMVSGYDEDGETPVAGADHSLLVMVVSVAGA